jgi:hypothetical protein
MENEELICINCKNAIAESDEYCTNCGIILSEDKKCYLHKDIEALGICLVCLKLCCKKCGLFVNNAFLCNEHSNYEIIEGMGRVYGSSDELELSFYKDMLEKEGLHPFIYSRKASPISLGGVDYSLFRASGEYDGHIINELKLMVPLGEMLKAERILESLKNEN